MERTHIELDGVTDTYRIGIGFGSVFFFLYLFGFYTNYSIRIGDITVWSVVCLAIAVFAPLRYSLQIYSELKKPFFWMFFLSILTVVFTYNQEYLPEAVKTLLSLFVIFLAIAYLNAEFSEFSPDRFGKFAHILCIVLLIGFALELSTPLREVSDAFRQWFYSGFFIYDGSIRDTILHGGTRPSFFTQEPSHPARFLAFFTFVAFVLSKKTYQILLTVFYAVAGLLLTRSPSYTILLALIPAYVFLVAFFNRSEINLNRATILLLMALLSVPTLVIGGHFVVALFTERIDAVASLQDLSTYRRFILPATVAYQAGIENFPFGTGVGGKQLILDLFLNEVEKFDPEVVDIAYYEYESWWNNGFFEFLIFYGFLGTAIGIYIWTKVFRILSGGYVLFSLFAFFLIFNLDSGYTGLRSWTALSIVLLSVRLSTRESETQTTATS